MEKYSISFTLGRASDQHGVNLAHNNRQFTAPNVDESRSCQNISYVRQGVREAYQQLFSAALGEYNAAQKKPCRRIQDYYSHIANGRREEPYYEAVVQFGDVRTAPCGSERGEIARQMLDEYMRGFQERNPNLHVFNAVLHLDEASPHLHIDFVPFYTQGRVNGLRKGVSMRSALDEMGFRAKSPRENRLVAWEARERTEMESILHRHGYIREDVGAHYAHMTVEEYKYTMDHERSAEALMRVKGAAAGNLSEDRVRRLQAELSGTSSRLEQLEHERQSPYRAFFYSAQEKQAWILEKLEEMDIPFRETENGFEAQACYVQIIRRLEKEYKAPRSLIRDQLREQLDRLVMQCDTVDDLTDTLREQGYDVRRGKYLSVRPPESSAYIRLKSLGEYYSEFALKNRIAARLRYEKALEKCIADARRADAPTLYVLRTVQLYTIAFSQGALPIRRRDAHKPFAWTNDAELDRLFLLHRRISEGATLDSLRADLAEKEKTASEKADCLDAAQAKLRRYYEMKELLEVLFGGKLSPVFSPDQAEQLLHEFPTINESNWRNIDRLIEAQQEAVSKASAEDDAARQELREAAMLVTAMEKVMGGTYVQSLVADENDRRDSEIVPNGIRPGGGAIQ